MFVVTYRSKSKNGPIHNWNMALGGQSFKSQDEAVKAIVAAPGFEYGVCEVLGIGSIAPPVMQWNS